MQRARRPSSRCGRAFERRLTREGHRSIAGVDEVGRGSLFGPVVAAAVILPARIPRGIDDSKRLSPPTRHRLALWLLKSASFALGSATHEEIDRLNIRRATFLAMRRALDRLHPQPDFVLVDGDPIPGIAAPQQALIKGDQRCKSIAAASVLAKVQRDALMTLYAPLFPCYNLGKNKGYCTAEHMAAIQRHGISDRHRRSFCGSFGTSQLSLSF